MRKFFPLFALVALAVGAFLVFGDHTAALALAASHDHIASLSGLSAAGLAPMMMGSTVTHKAVMDAIEEQTEAWVQFKTANNNRIKTLEDEVGQILKKVNRPGFGTMSGGYVCAEDAEYKQAFISWMRTGVDAALEAKSMSSGSDPDGGYLVPQQLDDQITKILTERSPMRQLSRVIQVDSPDFAMLHSVGGTGYTWVGETTARPETNTPQFIKIQPPMGEVYANPGLTQSIISDNKYDLEAWITEELVEVFDAAEGAAFIEGNGILKPRGILSYDIAATADGVRGNNDIQYVPSGASGAFKTNGYEAADTLVKLVHSLKPRYRKGAAWMMNTNTLEEVRKFKDSNNAYIWRAGLEAGQPGTLLGYPVYECEDMPDVSANSLSVAFGNFMIGYTITDRSTMMLRDPYTNKPYVHFYTTRRVGGAVRDTRAIKLMKFAAS